MTGSQLRVMVVDDEPAVRSVLVEILEDAGFSVVATASDGAEAVELACRHAPEAILMDMRMPKLDGIRATREICAKGSHRIVLLSAYQDPALQEEARVAGAAALYLSRRF